MDRKKKEHREYHVSSTDSPAWDEVEKQRAGMNADKGAERTREPSRAPASEEHRAPARRDEDKR